MAAVLGLSGCASNKAGMSSPQLPARHWLEESPGVPVENKAKIDAALPNLYDPSKRFTYEDCVYLTIQQSPVLVNSAVNIEIKRLAHTDAAWQYLPEPRMVVSVTNNLTRHNMDNRDTPSDYGQPKADVSFYAAFPNPIKTYFDNKVRKAMVNLAISTHRKAVGEAIYKIAQAYLKLQAQRDILAAKKAVLPLGKELIAYWQQVESVEGHQGAQVNLANQHLRELQLAVEQSEMEEVMQLTQLKILAGVNAQQRFNIDLKSADGILAGFDGRKLKWEDRWSCTEDDLLLRGQIKMADYNIMVAWAEYIPTMSIRVDKSPPSGQSNPSSGTPDYFLHLNFDFPLLDWGHRYRGVQTARMEKAQAFHDMASKRTDYSNEWLQAEQHVSLAETKLKMARTRFDTAKMQYEEADISYKAGVEELPVVIRLREDMANARIALAEAELAAKLARLDWMYLTGLLQERFLGLPLKNIID